MHVNEYVSQLSSLLWLSWTEAGAQLQGTVREKKKSSSKNRVERTGKIKQKERDR